MPKFRWIREDIHIDFEIKSAPLLNLIKEAEELDLAGSGDQVDLGSLFLHFRENPFLQSPSIHRRFGDCAIVDIFY